jgi:hypothetical protein
MTSRFLGLYLLVTWWFAGAASAVASQSVVMQLTGLR